VPHPVVRVLPHLRVTRANSRSNAAPARPGRTLLSADGGSGEQQYQQQSASNETLVQLEARAAIQLRHRRHPRRHLAQRTPPHSLAQLNNFGRCGQPDVRGGQAGAKGESGTATKKVMDRVGEG